MRHGAPGNALCVPKLRRASPTSSTLAKSLANGLPIGAVLIDAKSVRTACNRAITVRTFGGSPVPCAAALAHLRVRDALDLDAHVRVVGARLRSGLASFAERYPHMFAPPRGMGLMLGLPVREPHVARTFVDLARVTETNVDQRGQWQYAALRTTTHHLAGARLTTPSPDSDASWKRSRTPQDAS